MELNYEIKDQKARLSSVTGVAIPDSEVSRVADYLLFTNEATTKHERKQDFPTVTANRAVTINNRETSLDALSDSLNATGLTIYDVMNVDRDAFLDARDLISEGDIAANPELRSCYEVVQSLNKQLSSSTIGAKRYALKKQIIETWQQMYLIKASTNRSRCLIHARDFTKMRIDGNVKFDDDGWPQSDAVISLFNPTHVSFLLEFYCQLRQDCRDDAMGSDMHLLLMDLEALTKQVFPHDSELRSIMLLKMMGYDNDTISRTITRKYGTVHTNQYYSSTWRNRIPKMLATQASRNYIWYYWRQNRSMNWKRCAKCGQWKPAHPLFFRRNSNSSDGFYSKCKSCCH